MNIYFCCSITGGRQDEAAYQRLVEALLAGGHAVPTAHLSSPEVMALEAAATPADVYQRDIAWLDACEAVVAEVSTPSHGVGYEIAYALGLGKPVLCFYRQGRRVSKMITGNSHPTLLVQPYDQIDEALAVLAGWLAQVAGRGSKVTPN